MDNRRSDETKLGAPAVVHKALARIQLACIKTTKRPHTDGAQEQYDDKLKKNPKRPRGHQVANRFSPLTSKRPRKTDEHYFLSGKIGTAISTSTSEHSRYWSFAALDAVDKSNVLSASRDSISGLSKNTQMKLYGQAVDEEEGASCPSGNPDGC